MSRNSFNKKIIGTIIEHIKTTERHKRNLKQMILAQKTIFLKYQHL